MNFFEQQEKARNQSRWIIVAFLGVTLLIVVVVNLLVLAFMLAEAPVSAGMSHITQPGVATLLSSQTWVDNLNLIFGTSVATGGVIGLASLGKIASLRSGGGKVARDMGGVIVTPDTRDALRRRLYNVVEEIALASGTPVPEVYVMEAESAINAFAAGYTPADAAIAVTQGTLEKLTRSELQGVVAHEFSHIFNGDMRINIRMMGVIFGIMVLAIIGRRLLSSSRYRLSGSRNNNGGAIVAIGISLMAVGYIGLFFARWMKSALSRQREYLADASAVQFTRDPSGIAGALKKIAAYNHSSYLKADSEEVSHMLFSSGYRSLMFSTHPPLPTRISRIEKGFDSSEIERLAKKLHAQEKREHVQAEKAAQEQAKKLKTKTNQSGFNVDAMIDNIGSPEVERILAAAVLFSEIPSGLSAAAHSLEWAPEVLFYCLLEEEQELRDKQFLIIVQQMGDISESKVQHLISSNPAISSDQRLPLLEVCFPTLKRRPVADIEKILSTINMLAMVDNTVDAFEYLLSRLVAQHLREANNPSATKTYGSKHLKNYPQELSIVISIIAAHGHQTSGAKGLQLAQKAFKAGMGSVGINHTNLSFQDNWQDALDDTLKKLDRLTVQDKNKVVHAIATTVADDNEILTAEHEMMRVICSLIHVPLPLLKQVDFKEENV